ERQPAPKPRRSDATRRHEQTHRHPHPKTAPTTSHQTTSVDSGFRCTGGRDAGSARKGDRRPPVDARAETVARVACGNEVRCNVAAAEYARHEVFDRGVVGSQSRLDPQRSELHRAVAVVAAPPLCGEQLGAQAHRSAFALLRSALCHVVQPTRHADEHTVGHHASFTRACSGDLDSDAANSTDRSRLMARVTALADAAELLEAAPRAKFPEQLQPMLAKAGALPDAEGEHAYEVKWDGIRALVYVRDSSVHIESRNRNDITKQYPELLPLADVLSGREVVLDAEIVAFTEAGVPSFQLLQSRLGLTRADTIRTRAAATPATLAIFDILHLDGRNLMPLTYEQRRAVLATLDLTGPHWRVSEYHIGGGAEMLASVVERGLEGVMVKRLDAPYAPGKRTSAWTKVKQQRRQEFVVGGWTEGSGARGGRIGALLIGHHDVRHERAERTGQTQKLVYAGSVGTGFGNATLDQLAALLKPLATDESPFDVNSPGANKPVGKWQSMRATDRATGKPVASRVHYVRPELVVELEFTEFTRDGTLRHPSYQGLRDDKDPRDVVREDTPELTD
ncbi:MAG: hypothetical protein JWN41_552, partial [Thermoleophilia bacterium]|nr:hypothetical protein [Thermoleophilia bacterium]